MDSDLSCQCVPVQFCPLHSNEHDHVHRSMIHELQRELRHALLEIEKLTIAGRELANVNQDLEESRLLAVSDQARTARRLLLMSTQLEYTEQKLYHLTQEMDAGQRDSELLRIERIKREALQEREDAGRLKIETLQDDLQEAQRNERTLQQKLLATQTKHEAIVRRFDQVRRQQQEQDLARESREALAWLKETTDRLCSPPQGSLGQSIQQERLSLQATGFPGNTPTEHEPSSLSPSPSPSSSPPFQSSMANMMEPPLAAQNQLISLIKELATTNTTLRNELGEYRDLLQDSRNEVLTLRAQVEDYEQGNMYDHDGCCGQQHSNNGDASAPSDPWNAQDSSKGVEAALLAKEEGADTVGGLAGAPPPYATATVPSTTEHHLHHHFHLPGPGVRGNVFGELERLYNKKPPSVVPTGRHRSRSMASKKESDPHHPQLHHHHPRKGGDHRRHHHHDKYSSKALQSTGDHATATVSTSTSTSEIRRTILPSTGTKSGVGYGSNGKRDASSSRVESRTRQVSSASQRNKKSQYTDVDLDMLDSDDGGGGGGGEDEEGKGHHDIGDPTDILLGSTDSGSDDQEPGFIATFAEALSFLSFFSGPLSGSPP